MRRWLLIFMIALLPLRGWASDAMAMSLSVMATTSQAAAPCHGPHAEAVSMNGMALHSSGPVDVHPGMAHGQQGDDSASHTTCNACDICNVPAMALTAPSARSSALAIAHAIPVCERFASAVPQRGSKPPIA